MFSKFLVGAALVVSSFAIVLERPARWPESDWVELGKTSGTDSIKLGFALEQTNLEALEKLLLAVSTPGDPQYGNHRGAQELRNMVRPARESVIAVRGWLEGFFSSEQIVSSTETEELITVETSVDVAELVLNCEFFDYVKRDDQSIRVSRVRMGTDYEVDESVFEHLYFVSPTHRFPAPRNPIRKTSDEASSKVTPDVISALYKTNGTTGKSTTNKQGVAAFQGQLFSDTDTQDLWNEYNVPSCDLTRVPTNQGTGYGIESELDVQYITSTGRGISLEHWYTGGFNFPNSLLDWSESVLSASDPPPLFSVSYGTTETYYGESFITKFNTQLMMMGTAGISVLFASGDSGAGNCDSPPFEPDYPASSPYVTAVGGVTGGSASSSGNIGEEVWVDGGGGFSNFHSQPSWQVDAVQSYLNNAPGLPSSAVYNSSGRGYPDIAAQSVDFIIYVRGRKEGVSGTSCASPTAGGVFALLNDLRQQQGMSNMGYLNPFIWQTATADSTAFNDCVTGSNSGCTFSSRQGFPAYSQWDPASGWGSPNYEVLSSYVLKTGAASLRWQTNTIAL